MALEVGSVNLYAVENSKPHKTFKYEAVHLKPPSPIFRRGQEFVFDINFTGRAYNELLDKMRVLLKYEDKNDDKKLAIGGAWLTNQQDESEDMDIWSLRMVGKEGNTLKLKMRTPIKCPIGSWKMVVKTSLKSERGINKSYEHPETIYILLNPWNREDDVYMPDTHLLEEYVMNDIGKVYTGTRGRHWLFGQFEAHVLPACCKILKECRLSFNDKGDSVLLARMLTDMINIQDGGMLVGRWDGEYSDGTNPSMWTGSSPILKEYLENGPGVQYAQCWVFAAVTCTVCRALGMPARVVTNLVSAHDTDSTLTIDNCFTKDGEPLRNNDDSVWNFHVWNDVWMARPDLPPGYGGWQAIDATPQERSDGICQCGPASVVALKKGEVSFKYDMPFILAEVNADLIDWKEDEDALFGFVKIKTNPRQVGQKLLTKKPHIFDPNGDRDMDDVINQYKDPEGTKEERLSLLGAAFKCGYLACEHFGVDSAIGNEEVNFSIKDIKTIFIGNNFTLSLNIENTADEKRTAEIVLTLWSVYYNGIKGQTIKKVCENIPIPPKETKELKIEVTADEYLEKLVEFSLLKTHVIATIEETKQTWSGEDEFQITKPTLSIKVEEKLEVGITGKIFFIFTNPLKKKLTECQLSYECPGIAKHQILPFRDALPEETIKIEVIVTPETKGKLPLVGIFYSKQLHEVLGSATIDVV